MKIAHPEPVVQKDGSWVCRIMDDWLPLPAAAVSALGWTEGTEVEILAIANGQIVIRKVGSLSDEGTP